jgi:DNA-binding MarR family transcriptional regulator
MVSMKAPFYEDSLLTKTDMLVMGRLIRLMNSRNYVIDTQQEIADHLEVHRVTVSTSIKNLVDRGYIRHHKYRGRVYIQVYPSSASRDTARYFDEEYTPEEEMP